MRGLQRLLHSSIIRILAGGFLLVIVPTIALCLIYSYSSMDMLRDEYDSSYANNTKLISDQFSDKLRDLEMTAAPLLVDEDLVKMSVMDKNSLDLWSYTLFKSRLSLYFASRFIASNVSVILPIQQRVISTKYGVDSFSKYNTLGNLRELNRDQPLWAVRPSLRNPNEKCFSIIKGYAYPRQSRPLISIEISESEITGQLKALFGDNDKIMASFLIDINGKVFKLDKDNILNQNILQNIIKQNNNNTKSEPFTYKDKDGLYRIVFSKLDTYQCIIGIIYNEKEILSPVTRMMSFLVAILIFAAIAVAFYIIVSYRKIYSPANVLVDAMKRVAEGDFQSHTHIINNSEFGMMSVQFNNMVDQLDKSLKEKYLAQESLNKAHLKFLKSQIKPHFLYNCLYSIYNMIKSEDLDNAADMTMYLGHFYQKITHFDDKDTTILREMENIKLYLKIHQLRSPEKFDYSCLIDAGLEEMIIPSLSLQTIVENAISHAFINHDRKNFIDIKAIKVNENVQLIVEDNGIGLTEEQRMNILGQINNLDFSDKTHGIQNVFSRFRLMYGGEVKFNISTEPGCGTKFTFIIPKAIIKHEQELLKNV